MTKNPLDEIVRGEVRRRGRVTFAEYMGWALYHPLHGYYTAGKRTGRAGDFYTNVQVGPLFARLLVQNFREMWEHLGGEHMSLVELGASDGVLAERILTELAEQGRQRDVTYYAVERSPASREQMRRRLSRFGRVKVLEDLSSLEHVSGVDGCIFSNEFFDALPVHRVVRRGGELLELFVAEEAGRLRQAEGPLSTPRLAAYFREQGVELQDGQAAEVCLAAEGAFDEIERTLGRGFVLTIDYGEPSPDLYRETRTDGTLQVYRKHARSDDPFEAIGDSDITAFVDFGRLAELGRRRELAPLIFASQGTFFLNSGEQLLKTVVEKNVGVEKDMSAAAQVQHLLHPQSFGGKFHVLVQGKNVGSPELSGGKVNRIGRLAPVNREAESGKGNA